MPCCLRNPYFLFIIILLCTTRLADAQDYKAAVGIRFGYGWGLSAKGVIGRTTHVIEGLLRYGYRGVVFTQPGVNFTGLYEKHFPFGGGRNWAVLLGGGPSMGFGRNGSVKLFTIGIGPIVGLDVTARRLPVAFSIDYKPCFFIDKTIQREGVEPGVSYYEMGFSVRYALKK